MYCTTSVIFYCDGTAEETLPKFQAMLADVASMLQREHPAITAPDISEELTPDDVVENPGSEDLENFDD